MKKVILGVALAGLVISCQKIQAGGNHGVLKLENGVERYSDDVMTDAKPVDHEAAKSADAMALADSTAVSMLPKTEVTKDSATAAKPAPDTAPAPAK